MLLREVTQRRPNPFLLAEPYYHSAASSHHSPAKATVQYGSVLSSMSLTCVKAINEKGLNMTPGQRRALPNQAAVN